MSGFLRQLANRSLGLAPQVRSRAALPYAAPTADFSMTEASSHETPTASMAFENPESVTPQNAPRRAQVSESPQPAPVVSENIARADRIAAPMSTPAPRAAFQPSAIMDQQVGRDSQPNIVRHDHPTPVAGDTIASVLASNQKPVTQHREPALEARQPAESPKTALADIEYLVARLLGNEQAHPEKSPEVAAPPTIVTMRQTGQRPAEISTIRPQSSRERPAVVPETDTAPEVHITIGRLEVNPPSRPAPAAQPPRPRGPAPLSLADYLSRRNGGRS